MVCTDLSFWNKLELRIYRLLGINQFRKAILLFEKIKNRGKNRKNENYHPLAMDVISLEKHNGFLLYNSFLHAISMFFVIVYSTLACISGFQSIVVDVIVAIISLLNIYCIILQRANYLRIRRYIHRYYRRSLNRLSSFDEGIMRQIYISDPSFLLADYEVIRRLKNAFDGNADCFIRISEIDNLRRIQKCAESLLQRESNRKTNTVSKKSLLELCRSVSGPYTSLQQRADYLQRGLRAPGRKMLDRTAVITENAECEMLYRKLVPEDTISDYCRTLILLYELFSKEVEKVKANEIQQN